MVTEAQIAQCLAVLEAARELDPDDERYVRLERGVAHLVKSGKKKRRRARRNAKIAEDRAFLRTAGLAEARFGPTEPPPHAELHHQRYCYVCRAAFRVPHHFFHMMCGGCGDRALQKRVDCIDLSGRRALVTGGRVKIGYATALRLLRSGAEVHVTTRFAADAARRYAAEADADVWRDRLHVHGIDFRRLQDLLSAIEKWRRGPSFDVLINNAAQTVWHPPEHYRALHAGEAESPPLLVHRHGSASSTTTPALLDRPPATIDMSRQNSWTLRLADVAPVEMIEVQVVNVIAPFLLCSQMKRNMATSPHPDRYIVNVTALEGQFTREEKSDRHPHTNMAKAGLNMLTRTSAQDYVRDGIYMVSVDPGWMSNEGPADTQRRAERRGFHPPLEAIDCAARILDPVARGRSGAPVHGVLLKDFQVVPW